MTYEALPWLVAGVLLLTYVLLVPAFRPRTAVRAAAR
jgi:hypothetical protein